ncbi:hypothetical protein [Muriicola sp.]|uniref:hypothetical protein n=1 Tax=Muriicola sp. TaxID=2020856 RepID=UPI003C722DC5
MIALPRTYLATLIFFVFSLLFSIQGKAQETVDMSDYRVRFGFTAVKQADQSRLFKAEFTATDKKDRKNKIPIYQAEVKFLNLLDEQEVLLGKAVTNEEGIAQVTLPADHDFLTDEEGFMTFVARYEGSEALDEESEELKIQNLHLKLDLVEIDSVKTVIVNAFTSDSIGAQVPVNGAYVKLSVGGMLSKMVFADDFTDEGQLQVEFPKELPGDQDGNLTVFAMIEDDDNYGNVIQEQKITWGIPKTERIQGENMLWSEVAPFWMYVVLSILLVGVWTNFAYTVANLIKIKRLGKEVIAESDHLE